MIGIAAAADVLVQAAPVITAGAAVLGPLHGRPDRPADRGADAVRRARPAQPAASGDVWQRGRRVHRGRVAARAARLLQRCQLRRSPARLGAEHALQRAAELSHDLERQLVEPSRVLAVGIRQLIEVSAGLTVAWEEGLAPAARARDRSRPGQGTRRRRDSSRDPRRSRGAGLRARRLRLGLRRAAAAL